MASGLRGCSALNFSIAVSMRSFMTPQTAFKLLIASLKASSAVTSPAGTTQRL